jgi:hypothetical protein
MQSGGMNFEFGFNFKRLRMEVVDAESTKEGKLFEPMEPIGWSFIQE